MWYYTGYYIKKYWYILLLILLLIFAGVVYYMNNGSLISSFEKFENKVTLEPDKFKEEDVDSKTYLKDLIVGVPYIGESNKTYLPTPIDTKEEIEQYFSELEKDPNYMYKKKISWAYGELTSDQTNELVELVGYHLNKNSNKVVTIVRLPTPEQLSEYNQKVVYYTDDQGVLYLNLYVEEVSQASDTKKSYCYTFKLKYDMDGKVTIR